MAADEADEPVRLAIAARPDEGQHLFGQAGQWTFIKGGEVHGRALHLNSRAEGADHPAGAGAGPGATTNAAAPDLVGQGTGILNDMGLFDDALVGHRGGFHRQEHVGWLGEIIVQYRFDRDAHGMPFCQGICAKRADKESGPACSKSSIANPQAQGKGDGGGRLTSHFSRTFRHILAPG